jgi:hypothetical protein
MAHRLFRKAVQQGRSEQRGEAYSLSYVELLSDARTPLADFVNSLLAILIDIEWYTRCMATKHAKSSVPRRTRGRKPRHTLKGARGSAKSSPKQLPDTSRIPWFPALPKS